MYTPNKSQIIIYKTEDGKTKVEVRFENETVWLTQIALAELFQTTKQNISQHVQNIFEEGELASNSTVKNFLTVQKEGTREISRSIEYYNLDLIISVGYRVKSAIATDYLKKLRKRDTELGKYIGTNCPQVEMLTETGKEIVSQENFKLPNTNRPRELG